MHLLLLSLLLSLGFYKPSPVLVGDSVVVADSLANSLPLACPGDLAAIGEILFTGNRTTQVGVLRAELNIREGQVLSKRDLLKKLEENRLRLFNLQLFHWVRYEVWCQEGELKILFLMQERWYIWPVPIFDIADRNFNAWLDKRDFNRVDYGLNLRHTNFRGRNELLKVNLQHGFNRKFEFQYTKPYLTEKYRKIGGSIGFSLYQSRTLEYNTFNNILATYYDEVSFPIQRQHLSAALIYRQNVQKQTSIGLSIHQQIINDSVLRLNPQYFNNRGRRQFVQFELARVINLRNTFSYPLTGSFLQASLSQQVFFNTGSTPNTTLNLKVANYFDLSHGFYYSYGGELQTRLGTRMAYADNTALGYGSFVRGYELYVVGGQHYGLLKQGLSKRLLSIDQINLPLIGSSRFNQIPLSIFFNIFTDGAYVVDRVYENQNRLTNRLLVGSGVGVHIVTFYDRVFRLEYSFNRERERGFFIHTDFPF